MDGYTSNCTCGAGNGETHGNGCPMEGIEQNPSVSLFKPAEKPKQWIRVVMKNGMFFDMDRPADFSMIGYVSAIRSTGYILNEGLYVPLDDIQSIFTYNGEVLAGTQGVVLQFPSKPK